MKIEKILLEFSPEEKNILPALQKINDTFGFVGKKNAQKAAEYFSMPLSKIYETASFYDLIRTEPQPPMVVQVCFSTHCALNGSDKIISEVESILNMKAGDDNHPRFKLERISCIGRCGEGPVMVVNGTVFTQVRPEMVYEILEGYL